MDFNKIMEAIKMPKEYYKAEYYDNKHGTSVSDWLKLYKSSLSPPEPLEIKFKFDIPLEIKFKFDIPFKNKNHLPDELFEI